MFHWKLRREGGAPLTLSTSILKSMTGSFHIVVWRDHFLPEYQIVAGSEVIYNNVLHKVIFFTETAVMCLTEGRKIKIRTDEFFRGCDMYCQ